MLSHDIIDSDAFLDMPASSQLLYFHLAMRADDDGFVSPKKVMRISNATSDDLKVLVTKRFLLVFDSGVVVIKHWLIHNMIRKDRYHKTKYTEELEQLKIKQNKAYTEMTTNGLHSGNQMATEVRLGKVRLGKNNTCDVPSLNEKKTVFSVQGAEIIKAFEEIDPKNKRYYNNKTQREACDFLIREYGFEQVLRVIKVLPRTNVINYMPTITTPCELREKWVKLESQLLKKKDESSQKGRGFAT